MGGTEIAILEAVSAAVTAVGLGWLWNQWRRKKSFAITAAVFENVPLSDPAQTELVVTVDSSNDKAKPTLTALEILDKRQVRSDLTFKGDDAARLRDGKLKIGDLGNDKVVVEVLRDGESGSFDLSGLEVRLRAGNSAASTTKILKAPAT